MKRFSVLRRHSVSPSTFPAIRWLTASISALLPVVCMSASEVLRNFQDSWWNPEQSGMGLMVLHQENTIAGAWFFYDESGKPTFLTFSGPLVGNAMKGSLRRTTGPRPGAGYSPAQVSETAAGNATLTFTSDSAATFEYNVDGLAGTMYLSRFNFSSSNLTGDYRYADSTTYSDCPNPANNGSRLNTGYLKVAQNGNAISIQSTSDLGNSCTFTGTYDQNGTAGQGSASMACQNGAAGNTIISNVRKVGRTLTANFVIQYTSSFGCTQTSNLAAAQF